LLPMAILPYYCLLAGAIGQPSPSFGLVPDVAALDHVYWQSRKWATEAYLNTTGRLRGNGQSQQFPFQGMWPCLWGEEPVAQLSTEDKQLEREGWKWVCGLRQIRSKRCVIYSVGSNKEVQFERGVKAARPDCEVHVFDHPLFLIEPEEANLSNISLHPYWFDTEEHQEKITFWADKLPGRAATSAHAERRVRVPSTVSFTTLRAQMRKLGHDHIDILKIDIEGKERVIVESLSQNELASIGQLQMELHLTYKGGREGTVREAERTLGKLEHGGFRVFQSDPNWLRPPKLEVSLIRRSWDPYLFAREFRNRRHH